MRQRSVIVIFPVPKTHKRQCSQGPIIGIEILQNDGEHALVYVTADDDFQQESFPSLVELCASYGFRLDEIIDIIARAYIQDVGS